MDEEIRLAAFNWLSSLAPARNYVLDWNDLTQGFFYKNEPIILIGAKGIWKPRQLSKYTISITSVEGSQYSDEFVDDDTLLYSYRGDDPMHPDNVGLRNAMKDLVPLIYLHQISKGKYFVAWPVFIVGDEPNKLRFTVAAENKSFSRSEDLAVGDPEVHYRRKYETREVLSRLHQSTFRENVLRAYRDHCSVCRIRHRELLDAAHIIPDREEKGEPIVSNGISLCKIHHAAYDNFLIGITPDYRISVRADILDETDGPMLKHGIQGLNHNKIVLPRKRNEWPDSERLELRYQRFLSA